MTRLSAIVLLLLSSVAYGQTTPISNLTATWNNGSTTFNAIKMDITDTVSAAGSSALWLGFAGTPVFNVDKDGTIYASAVAMPTISSIDTLTNKTIVAASNTLTLFAGGANNQLLTDDGSGGLVSESGLVFDGTNLGIGTAAPVGLLDVAGAGGINALARFRSEDTTGFDIQSDTSATRSPQMRFKRASGSFASPTAVTIGQAIGDIVFRAYDGADYETNAAQIRAVAAATATSNDAPANIQFFTHEDGSGPDSLAVRMTITHDGKVGIGAVPGEAFQVVDAISISSEAEGTAARLTRRTAHETHTLANAATSDTTTISIPSGARLLAVSFNVNTAVVDDGGDDTWSAAFVTGSTTTLATAAAAAQNTKVDLMLPDEISTGICQIRFTAQGGSFSAGVIEIVAYFETLTSLAS